MNEKIKIIATAQIEAAISRQELGTTLMRIVLTELNNPDDAGCNWYTDDLGGTFITDNPEWQVSANEGIAALVDAANWLKYGQLFKIEHTEAGEDMQQEYEMAKQRMENWPR